MKEKPLLSICTVAYNHEKYIARALDSFLMQKTDFPFQIIVGDDASTDGTTDIIREYAKKHPNIIKPIFHKKNIGGIKNSLSVYEQAKTEFVALCDGDDYWIDNTKLQRQVDMLRNNKTLSVSYHLIIGEYEDKSHENDFFPCKDYRFNSNIITIKQLLIRNPVHTCSAVFRWRFKEENIRNFMMDNICPGDYFLILLHADIGNIGFIDRVMSVYYRNHSSISYGVERNPDKVYLRFGEMEMNWFSNLDRTFCYKYTYETYGQRIEKSKAILKAYMKNGAVDKLEKMKSDYTEFYFLASSQIVEPLMSVSSVYNKCHKLHRKLIRTFYFFSVIILSIILYLIIW